MLILISPAKTMSATSRINAPASTLPRFNEEAQEIALNMAQYSSGELSEMLNINSKMAAENYLRFQNFLSAEPPALQALLAYTGIVFKNINPSDFTLENFESAQKQLRIVSFMYGLLRPLDLIKPYRIEFDVKLPELGDGNMSDYWQNKLTSTLIDDINVAGKILVNLASVEIQSAFIWKKIEKSVRIITPEFKIWKNGKLQTIVIYTKMARGQMSRFIIKNEISNPEDLKAFEWEGFSYNHSLSQGNSWIFTQQ
jgi:cytoplasmic iron level regulating protein YaaA (DUF328/UPF0246 family)